MKQYKQDMERIHAPDQAKAKAFDALTQNNRRPRLVPRLALVAAVMLVLAGSFALLPHVTEPAPHIEASSQASDTVSEGTSDTVESTQSASASSDSPDASEPPEEPDYSELIGVLGPTASTVGKETSGDEMPDIDGVLPNYTEPFIGIGGYSGLNSPEATAQKTNGKYLWRVCGGLSGENCVLKTYVLDGENTRMTSEILLSAYDTAMPSRLLQEDDRLIVLTPLFGTYAAQTEGESQKGTKPRTEIRIYDLSKNPGDPLLIKTLYQDGNATLCGLKDGKLSLMSGYTVRIYNVEGKEPIDLSRPEWLNQCIPSYTDGDQTTLLSPDQLFVCEEGNAVSVFSEIDVTEGKFENASSVIGNSVIRFETEAHYYMFSVLEQHDCRIQSFVLQDGKLVQTASGTFRGFTRRCYEQDGYVYVFASRPYPDEPLYLHVLDDSLQTVASIIANEDYMGISEFYFRDSLCFLQESSYTNEIVLRSVIDLSDPTAPRLLDVTAYEPINTRTQVYNDDLSLNLARIVHVNAIGVRFYENVLTMYDTSDPTNQKVVSEYHAKDPYSFGLDVKFILPERGLICLAGSALWYEDKWETISDTGILLLRYDEQTCTFEQVHFCGTPYRYGNKCETVIVGDCLYTVFDQGVFAIDLNTFEEIAAI